jgi:hypothetical protein
VWDHGEGPHNPMAWANPHEMWYANKCVPPSVWGFVTAKVQEAGLEDSYMIVWLKGHEVSPPCSQ